jgi:hypothetical protein
MTQQNNNDSIELPLSGEEYENASAEMQVRSDYEVGLDSEITHRDDVEDVLTIRAGTPPKFCENDTRRYIVLYDTPAGWLFYCEDESHIFTSLHREKPDHHVFTNYAMDFVEHAIEEHGYSFEKSFDVFFTDETSELAFDIVASISRQRA